MSKGEKVGLVSVHLYRPFSAKHFLAAVPKTAELSLFLTVLKNREQTVNLCIWMLKTASMEQKMPRLS